MQYLEYKTVDKSEWTCGPWTDEPDKIQFQDEQTGLPCLIVRNQMGALCGYVGINKNHPHFKKEFTHEDFSDIMVHGGLTFSDTCQEGDECHSICHKVEKGEDDHIWWLGFDCNHSEDLSPRFPVNFCRETYKDIEYVKRQCKLLAKQLKEVEKI